MAHNPHSDLEVVPQSENLENQKYPYYSPEPIPAQPHFDDTNKISYQPHDADRPRTICGLRKRTFWIVLIVAIIVVAAAVGGGVGGALSSKSSSSSSSSNSKAGDTATTQPPSPQTTDARSSTSPTPTISQPSITTSTLVGPSTTITRDCPSSNNTIYSATFGDTVMQFRKACEISFVNPNGIDSVIGRPVVSLNECINQCASYNIMNRTAISAGTNRICNAVCWRNTFDKTINDWPGGMCFGFTTQNVTSGGETAFRYKLPAETRCDSAALMNQEF